jgi:hypothetical protein
MVDSQTNDVERLNLILERIRLGGDFHMTHCNDASLHALTIVRAQEHIRLELSRLWRSRLLVHLGVRAPSSPSLQPQRFVIFIPPLPLPMRNDNLATGLFLFVL